MPHNLLNAKELGAPMNRAHPFGQPDLDIAVREQSVDELSFCGTDEPPIAVSAMVGVDRCRMHSVSFDRGSGGKR